MPVQLTNHLRENLSWLASNWEAKQLQYVSSFNENFYAALLSILDGSATRAAVELVISGTRGKVADGYGYMWWTSVPATRQRSSTAILLRPTFWADGYLGQYAVVVPSLNLVVVSLVDSRLTSKRMGQSKMERLMWLTEAAQNASGIGPDPLMAEGR